MARDGNFLYHAVTRVEDNSWFLVEIYSVFVSPHLNSKMSEYQVPGQFLEESQNGEDFSGFLDLDAFSADHYSEFTQNEPTNEQEVGPTDMPEVHEQPKEDAYDVEIHPPVDFDDFSTIGQPTEDNQIPDLPSDLFGSKEWQDLAKNEHDQSLEDILGIDMEGEQTIIEQEQRQESVGTSSYYAQPPVNSRQQSPVVTRARDSGYGTAAVSEVNTQGETPVQPYQNDNTAGYPGPSGVRGASIATNSTATHPMDDPLAVDDMNPDEWNEEYQRSDSANSVTFETYAENDPLIVPDVPQRGRGRTGRRNGLEVWFNPSDLMWQPSASHHDMRETLIAKAQAEYPDDRYLHSDPTDGLPHGETAFFKPHQNRGPNRDQCADELFVWREYKSKKDENGKPLKKGIPKYTIRDHPGFMYEGDKILLDPHDNPVVNHKFIPLTLSAHTDGGKLQEMALQPGCRQVDLWARMPRWEKRTNKSGQSAIVSLRDKNTRINMPMTRFREKKGTIAGGDREGTETIMEGLARFYHHHGFDPVASGNSVKAFPRDLQPWEVKEVRLGNTARFGGRAGNRALNDEQRQDNLQKTLKAIENGKKKTAANGEVGTRKRGLEDEHAGSPDSAAGPRKRHRGGQELDSRLVPLNEGYTDQQGAYLQAPPPPQAQINAYGVPEMPYQRSHFQGRTPPIQNPSDVNQNYRNVGNYFAPAHNRTLQTPYGGVYTQGAGSPYANALTQGPLNNSMLNSQYYPADQYSQIHTGAQRVPSFTPGQPQQSPHRSSHRQSFGTGRHNVAQNGTMPAMNPAYDFPAGVNDGFYGAAVQRQRHFEDANSASQRPVNTIAPGGRRPTQAPEEILGKRRHRDTHGVESAEDRRNHAATNAPVAPNSNNGLRTSAVPTGVGQSHIIQAYSDPDFGAAHKRRRHNPAPGNPAPGSGPRPQRQRQPERAPPRIRYGAEGAPTPFFPPDEFFGNGQPTLTGNGNVEGRLKSPGELFRELGGVFGAPDPMPTTDRNATNVAPARRSEYLQRNSGGYEPQQILGKRGRRELLGQQHEAMYLPLQSLQQLGSEVQSGGPEQDTHAPRPKRRHMPGSEGSHALPAQAPKLHRAERNSQLVPPQLHVNQPILNAHQGPPVEGLDRTSAHNTYINGTPTGFSHTPQIANSSGPNPPLAPRPPRIAQQAPSDIRDVRPSNGWQSESLDHALKFTRAAYRQWTGMDAPVTNIEDCYNVQYREIRAALYAWWKSEHNPRRLDPVPRLWRMRPWSGELDEWIWPADDEHLREVVKRGKRAA